MISGTIEHAGYLPDFDGDLHTHVHKIFLQFSVDTSTPTRDNVLCKYYQHQNYLCSLEILNLKKFRCRSCEALDAAGYRQKQVGVM